MSVDKLWSLDRIEGSQAVLVSDDRVCQAVSLSILPIGACRGKMYRQIGEDYVEDPISEQRRREQVREIQNRLRCAEK